ncbi:hypothetical protein MXB_5027 [Myxobolus squamalis]|nr:hypothetical protein MXB_5027 [Myxobolus squamalis]
MQLSAEKFYTVINVLKPKYIQIPAILIPTGLNTTKYRKAVDKSINFVHDLSKMCDFKRYNFIGTIVGGGSREHVLRCVDSGYVIDDYKNLDPLLLTSILN